MNNWALKTEPVSKFENEIITKGNQLITSRNIQEVCNSICRKHDLKSRSKSELNLFCVRGPVGSGRTTFCKAVLKNLIQSGSCDESETTYIKIDQHDNIDCVWNCGLKLARLKNLGNTAVLLTSQSSTLEIKENVIVNIFNSFKVVCFDNFPISEIDHRLYSLLVSIVYKLKTNVICIMKDSDALLENSTLVDVNGLNPDVIGSDLGWRTAVRYLDNNCKSLDISICLNPKAVGLLVSASCVLGILKFQVVNDKDPVVGVLNLIWMKLNDNERMLLMQLSELRQELPLKDVSVLSGIMKLGLVEYKPSGTHGNLLGQVILCDSIREFVLTKKDKVKMVKIGTTFDVLQCWMTLLSDELIGLIEEAKNNSWPFVPEKWYVKMLSITA